MLTTPALLCKSVDTISSGNCVGMGGDGWGGGGVGRSVYTMLWWKGCISVDVHMCMYVDVYIGMGCICGVWCVWCTLPRCDLIA